MISLLQNAGIHGNGSSALRPGILGKLIEQLGRHSPDPSSLSLLCLQLATKTFHPKRTRDIIDSRQSRESPNGLDDPLSRNTTYSGRA